MTQPERFPYGDWPNWFRNVVEDAGLLRTKFRRGLRPGVQQSILQLLSDARETDGSDHEDLVRLFKEHVSASLGE